MCALALGHDGIGSDLWRWGAHNIIKFLRGEMLRDSGSGWASDQEVKTGEMQNGYILFYRLLIIFLFLILDA